MEKSILASGPDSLIAYVDMFGYRISLDFSTGCPIILPRESESVLLGAAILGAVAAKKYASVKEAMKALNAAGQVCIRIHSHLVLTFMPVLDTHASTLAKGRILLL